MDPQYKEDVKRFHMMIGVSRKQPVKCAVCAWGDEVVVTFYICFCRQLSAGRRFFRKLRQDGISVRLEGNELCAARKRDMYPRIRKILILQKGGEEKAAVWPGK